MENVCQLITVFAVLVTVSVDPVLATVADPLTIAGPVGFDIAGVMKPKGSTAASDAACLNSEVVMAVS
jgi:hypothetical protein